MRAFIGVQLEDCRSEIQLLQEQMKRQYYGNYTLSENIHLTLLFLGEIDDAQQNMIHDLFQLIHIDKFSIELNELTSFHDMIVIKIQPNVALNRVYEQLRKQLISHGFFIDERPYFPHITLARQTHCSIKQPLSLQTKVNEINLFASIREAGKLQYKIIAKTILK
ncbi:MAG: RNA 2',3'-cyclic phosphodiesterase [Bacilli bacterium]|nr:RNA 2',3'-cyclic phosphodiesterase [Bacilli bacterium]